MDYEKLIKAANGIIKQRHGGNDRGNNLVKVEGEGTSQLLNTVSSSNIKGQHPAIEEVKKPPPKNPPNSKVEYQLLLQEPVNNITEQGSNYVISESGCCRQGTELEKKMSSTPVYQPITDNAKQVPILPASIMQVAHTEVDIGSPEKLLDELETVKCTHNDLTKNYVYGVQQDTKNAETFRIDVAKKDELYSNVN